MGYRVRTTVGEMTYGNIEQLRQAMEFGLVGPDALVFEPDQPWGCPASKLVGLPASASTRKATRRMARPRRRSPVASYVLMAIGALGLLYLELPRLTVMFPRLWYIPGMAWIIRRPNPGGAVVLPPWAAGFVTLPRDLGWVDLGAGAFLLLVFLFGLFAATLESAAFLALLSGYFVATGRIAHAAVLGLGAVLLLMRGYQGARGGSVRRPTASARARAML